MIRTGDAPNVDAFDVQPRDVIRRTERITVALHDHHRRTDVHELVRAAALGSPGRMEWKRKGEYAESAGLCGRKS